MPDQIVSQRVIAQGGLNTLNNYLTLAMENPGAAVRLQNFESSLSGGYRRVNGFRPYDADFPEVGAGVAEGRILGVWFFYNTATKEDVLIAARKDIGATTYKLYYYTLGVGWTAFAPGFTLNTQNMTATRTVHKVRAEIFNFGDKNQIIFVDNVNNAYVYDGTTWTQIDPTNPIYVMAVPAPSIVTSFKNHIFISGDEDYPAIIAHSAPSDIADWSAASGGGQIVYGFDVVQIKPFRDELFAFGKTNIKRIIVSGTDFVLQDVTNNLGCVARDSVLEVGGSLIFLSHDGVRPIAGSDRINDVELGLLSQDIQDILDDAANVYDFDFLNGVVIRNKSQFRYFLSNDAYVQEEGYGIIGCIRMNPQVGSSSTNRWEYSTLYGIRASCCWSGIVGTSEVVLHGDYDGIVYQQERGNNFNGRNITAIYTTPYLDIVDDTEIRKTIRELNVFLKTEGSFNINIAVRFDWGRTDAHNPSNYSGQINGAANYDDPGLIYDDPSAVYGGRVTSVFETPIQGSGRSVQYRFSSNDTNAPYTIHGFVHEFSPYGRQ